MNRARDRRLILAVWLIAFGSIFVIRDVAGWTWGQAWPLFIVFVGVGNTFSTLLGPRQPTASLVWSISWPVAAIIVGTVLLLSTTGNIAVEVNELIGWWPLVVIAIGVWFLIGAVVVRQPKLDTVTLSLPLDGAASARVHITFGGGELDIGPAPAGMLLVGRFEGGVNHRVDGPGQVKLEPDSMWPFGWGKPLRWDVDLATDVPLDLHLETGANRSVIDLSTLRIRRLELKTGASETRIALPAQGETSVRAEAGVASVTLEVPTGVAARIRSKVALGETTVDTRRFPRTDDGWASPDYESSANRVDIDVQGGLGSVRIT